MWHRAAAHNTNALSLWLNGGILSLIILLSRVSIKFDHPRAVSVKDSDLFVVFSMTDLSLLSISAISFYLLGEQCYQLSPSPHTVIAVIQWICSLFPSLAAQMTNPGPHVFISYGRTLLFRCATFMGWQLQMFFVIFIHLILQFWQIKTNLALKVAKSFLLKSIKGGMEEIQSSSKNIKPVFPMQSHSCLNSWNESMYVAVIEWLHERSSFL